MLRHELRQHRNEMDPCERDRGADAQSSFETCSRSARGELGLGRFLEGPPGAVEIAEARFGRRETAGRSGQELDAQIILKLGNRLRHGWLTHAKLSGRSGKGARLDDPYERLH